MYRSSLIAITASLVLLHAGPARAQESASPTASPSATPAETAAPTPTADAPSFELAPGAVLGLPAPPENPEPFDLPGAPSASTPIPTPTPAVAPTPAFIEDTSGYGVVPVFVNVPTGPALRVPHLQSLSLARLTGRLQHRPVMIIFSGESQASQAFERAISSPEVASRLGDYVVVRLDYRQNRELAHEFSVGEFPYVVFLNRWGYSVGHLIPASSPEVLARDVSAFRAPLY